MDSPTMRNWLFETSVINTEPTTGLPIMYDCTGGMSQTFILCNTIYDLKGGMTLSYRFSYNDLSKTRWAELDNAMRKFAFELIDDEEIRKLNGFGGN
jgi:hypothetical protein